MSVCSSVLMDISRKIQFALNAMYSVILVNLEKMLVYSVKTTINCSIYSVCKSVLKTTMILMVFVVLLVVSSVLSLMTVRSVLRDFC